MPGPARLLLRVLAAIALLTAGGALTAQQALAKAKPTFSTPGYHWNHKLPKVAPVVPGRVLQLGDGLYPRVLVDAAGTGQIAWTTQPEDGTASVLHDCVLLRGQTNCAASAGLIPPEQGDPRYSIDEDGPQELTIGNELLMIDHRYPNPETLPDGQTGYPTFLWTSEDGGRTFTGPGIIGELDLSGNAIAFGGSAPQIGVITDTTTGGTLFQATPPGAFTRARLFLGDQGTPDEAYNGRLAVDGTEPIAEFADLSDHIFIREYNGVGDINNSASWSNAVIQGQGYSRIVGGNSGVWLLYQKTFGGPLFVQKIVHGVPAGAPNQVTPNSTFEHAYYDIIEDSSGRLTVGWFVGTAQGSTLDVSSSVDGRHWSTPQPIATKLPTPSELALGAAQDGGGFAAFTEPEPGGASHNKVAVVAFGSPVATGLKGLGNVDGDGLGGIGGDPLGSVSCTDVHFGDIDALAESGCFLRDPSNPTSGAAIISGEIRLNGLEIIPDAGVQIVIDPKQHTINTTGSVRVVLRAPGLPDITLWHGELHVGLGGGLAGAGQTLFDFDTSQFPVSLEGFPIDGHIAVQIQHDEAVIPISLKLPDYMGGITGQATLTADNANGLQISSLHIGVPDLVLGALELKDLSIDYTQSGDVWSGGATLNIPAGTPYFGITVAVRFDHGDFTMGQFDAHLPFPGAPIFTDAYLSGFGGGFDIHPGRRRFFGSIDVGAIPLDPPNYTIGVTGTVSITFTDNGPVILEADGSATIHGFNVANAKLVFQSNGYFAIDGTVDIDLDVAELTGRLSAFVDLPGKEFSSELNAQIQVAGEDVSGADAVVSTKGVAACGSALGVDVGFAYPWGGTPEILGPLSCDVSPYVVQPVSAAREARTGAIAHTAAVKTSADAPVEEFKVTGAGGAPSVVLDGPHRRVVPVALGPGASSAAAVALADPKTDTTYVGLRKPGSGTWTVSAAPGSVAITGVAAARGFAPARVTGRVSGHGARRRLTYTATARSGLTMQFVESGKRGYRLLGTARSAHGTLSFAPAPGAAGKRTIYALVTENGVAQRRIRVATYTAPAPRRPGRPRALRVTVRGKRFAISFRAPAGAATYQVRLTGSDGRHVLTVTRRRSLTAPVLGYADRLTVAVTALSADQLKGPTATARARAR